MDMLTSTALKTLIALKIGITPMFSTCSREYSFTEKGRQCKIVYSDKFNCFKLHRIVNIDQKVLHFLSPVDVI